MTFHCSSVFRKESVWY